MDYRNLTFSEYAKVDRLADEYARAGDKAAYLAEIWGDLSSAEGKALLQAIDEQAETYPAEVENEFFQSQDLAIAAQRRERNERSA